MVLASDKGEQIGAEGSIIDRNNILEQLQVLKQQLLVLRKTIEQQIHIHEATAAHQAKLVGELADVMDWFYAQETEIQSHPLLLLSLESVAQEIEKHEVIIKIFSRLFISQTSRDR